MDRRGFLAGAGGSIAATLGGCLGGPSGGGNHRTADEESTTVLPTGTEPTESSGEEASQTDEGPTPQFLQDGDTAESAGARELLATVEAETDGLYRFSGDDDTDRKGFRAGEHTWDLRYYGTPHGRQRFRDEIAALATAFASHRPAGVSLTAESYHECTTGTWRVDAETAAAYERGDLDRGAFVDRVQERADVRNDC